MENKSCNIDNDARHTLVYVISGMSAVSAICCLFAIILLVAFRMHKKFKHRLVCHLLSSVMIFSVMLTLELVTIDYDPDDASYVAICKVVGFLVQCTVCTQFLCICTFVLYLTVILFFEIGSEQLDRLNRWDVAAFIPWFLPILFSWIPFLHDAYGLSGAWCWIRIQDENCETIIAGIVEQFVLWYGPLCIFSAINTLMIIIFAIKLWHKAVVKKKEEAGQDKFTIPSEVTMVPYLIIYQILAYISLTNRLHRAASSDHSHTSSYGLWIAHALSVSNWGLFASLYFFILLLLTKKCSPENIENLQKKWIRIAVKYTIKNRKGTPENSNEEVIGIDELVEGPPTEIRDDHISLEEPSPEAVCSTSKKFDHNSSEELSSEAVCSTSKKVDHNSSDQTDL